MAKEITGCTKCGRAFKRPIPWHACRFGRIDGIYKRKVRTVGHGFRIYEEIPHPCAGGGSGVKVYHTVGKVRRG